MNPFERELVQAIQDNDTYRVIKVCNSGYHFGDYKLGGPCTWLDSAIPSCSAALVEAMLDAGFDINALRLPEKSTALTTAIGFDRDEIVELLLRRGANPNLGRPLIRAVNFRKTPERQLKYVRLLVEHGAEVNRLYDLYGDPTNQFTVLDWTSVPTVIEYLQAHGAKKSAELKASSGQSAEGAAEPADQSTPAAEVVRYFEANFGPVDARVLIEIVPMGHPISIHAIRPEGDRQHLTLFTTGLSDKPMPTPPGQEDFAWAELFVQLPGDWPCGPDCPPEKAWVIQWLRKIAQYPHDNHTWLGGFLTVVDNENPPRPLGPNVRFTSWLLTAEKSFPRTGDGARVQLYRLTPLHPDERDLERREGAPALMRAFDRASVPFVVDMRRESVVHDAKG